jgi:uroporphyrinogen decarboxylase
MTSRERILAALAHREADRVPFDMGSLPVTGIHRVAYVNLRAALGLPARQTAIYHMMQQLAVVDEDVHEAMRTDCRGVRPNPPAGWRLELTHDADFSYFVDEWGLTRRTQRDRGYYYDLCTAPLGAVETATDVAAYRWPAPADDARLEGVRARCEALRAQGKAVLLGGVGSGMMEFCQAMRGFEQFYCDLAGDTTVLEAIADKVLELKCAYWSLALSRLGDVVDVVQEGDDFGGQHGLLMSLPTWRRIFRPRVAHLFRVIKRAAPGVRLLYHSCGSVRAILPDLIECGMEVLNPVQVSAAQMDTRELKRDFGKALTFWGGGVDTQQVLPRGTPQQVRDEVKRRIDDLAPGGGFVFASVHNIQDVPAANILAMRDALAEFGGYG